MGSIFLDTTFDGPPSSMMLAEAILDCRKKRLGETVSAPWSLAELGLGHQDYLFALSWLSGQDEEKIKDRLGRSQSDKWLGAALLLLASEAGRRTWFEGNLWEGIYEKWDDHLPDEVLSLFFHHG